MNLIELLPVLVRQPVGRLDLAAVLDVREKLLLSRASTRVSLPTDDR